MRIAICDDNIQELASISKIIEQFKIEHYPDLTYEVFNSPRSLLNKVEKHEFDLLLLDIIMPDMTGIELATVIRSFDMHLPIIFLTSSTEFAISSYRVHAKDYLLKPIDTQLLYDALLGQIESAKQVHLVKTTDSIMQIPLSQIVYFESLTRKLFIHLEDDATLQILGTLAEHEEQLSKFPQFYKPHRSYFVNLQHVRKLDKEGIHTSLGHIIPIPKPTYTKAKEVYMNYLMS